MSQQQSSGPSQRGFVLWSLGVFCILTPGVAHATDYFYQSGVTNGNWGDSSVWLFGSAPPTLGFDTDIFIQGSDPSPDIQDIFNFDVDYTINSITLDSGYSGVDDVTLSGGDLIISNLIENSDSFTKLIFANKVRTNSGTSFLINAVFGDIVFNQSLDLFFDGVDVSVTGGQTVTFGDGFESSQGLVNNASLSVGGGTLVEIAGGSSEVSQVNVFDGTVRLTVGSGFGSNKDVDLSGVGTFDLNGFNANIDKLTGSGSVLLGGATLTFGESNDFAFDGVISGTGGITKNQTGAATLSAGQAYTGTTSIDNGTLRLAGSGRIGNSSDVVVSASGTFDLNGVADAVNSISGSGTILLGGGKLELLANSGSFEFSGDILESGELEKEGNTTLTLSGNNGFSLLDINGGTVVATNSNSLGSSSASIQLASATLRTDASMTSARAISLLSTLSTINVSVGTFTQSGTISGSGELNKSGNGVLVLDAFNTYTGKTDINDGVVRLGASNRISNSSDVELISGATLDLNGFADTVASLSGSGGTVDTGGSSGSLTVIASSGTYTYSGSIFGGGTLFKSGGHTLRTTGGLSGTVDVVVNGGVWDLLNINETVDSISGGAGGTIDLGTASLIVDENSALTRVFWGDIIADPGSGDFSKRGTHTLTLAGNNTFGGELSLVDGVLRVSSDSNLGSGSTLVFQGGELNTTASFTNTKGTQVGPANSGTINVNSGTTLTQSGDFSVDGTAAFTKTGGGTFALDSANNNTIQGQVSVLDGTIQITGSLDSVLGNWSLTLDGGTLETDTTHTGINGFTVGSNGGTVDVGTGTTLSLAAGSSIDGTGSLTKTGDGVLELSDNNVYGGDTLINGGIIRHTASAGLPDTTDVAIAGGATWDLNGISDTVGALSGVGTVLLGGGTLTVGAGNGDGDFSGTIQESGALVKTGLGVQVLGGSNSYNAGTTIDQGTLEVASDAGLGAASAGLIFNEATLRTTSTFTTARDTTVNTVGQFETADGTTLTLTNPVTGPGGLSKAGNGTLVLTGNNLYFGETTLSGGTLIVDANNRFGFSTLNLIDGTLSVTASFSNGRTTLLGSAGPTIDVADGATLTQSGPIADATPSPGQFTKAGEGTLQLTALNTYTGPTVVTDGELQILGAGRLPDTTDLSVAGSAAVEFVGVNDAIDALAGDGAVELAGGARLTIGANDGGDTFSGVISGNGSLVKAGTGTQTLRTRTILAIPFHNTFTGGVAINGGVLDVEDNLNLGDPGGPLSFGGGTLQVSGDHVIDTPRPVTLDVEGGTLSVVGENASMDLTGVISGPGSLSKVGTGQATLAAANTYLRDTIIEDGLLQLQGAGRLPDTTSVYFNVSGNPTAAPTLRLNDISHTVDGLFSIDSGEIDLGSATLTIGASGGGGFFGGEILGTGGVVKIGAGTQVFTGENSYLGGTDINGGVIEIDADNRLGNFSNPLRLNGGELRTTASFTTFRNTTLNSGGGVFNVANASTLTHEGVILGSGGLTKRGAGVLLLNGGAVHTGPTSVEAGELRLGSTQRLPDQTDIDVAGGAIFSLNNFNETIDGLNGSGTVDLGSGRLVVGFNDGSGTFSGVVAGAGDLLKEGTGVQTLTGANTFDGVTFVDRGELVLSGGGSIDQAALGVGFNIGSNGQATVTGAGTMWNLSGNVFVGFDGTGRLNIDQGAVVSALGVVQVGDTNPLNPAVGTLMLDGGTLDNTGGGGVMVENGTLGGDGTIIGDVTNASAVAPGTSAGVLDITGNYTQDAAGLLSIEVGGDDNSNLLAPQFDALNVTGTASLAGDLEVTLIDSFTPGAGDTFTVLSASLLTGGFTNVANGGRVDLISGGTGSFQVNYGPGSAFDANLVVLSDFIGTGTGLPADLDGDGDVDGVDISGFFSSFTGPGGGPPSNPLADLDNDGDVDGVDISGAFSAFTGPLAPVNVPEPGSLVLLGLSSLLTARRRRAA